MDRKSFFSVGYKIFFVIQHVSNVWFVSYLFMSFQFLILGHGSNDHMIEEIFQYYYGYPYFFILFLAGLSNSVIRKKTGKYFSKRNWIDLVIAGIIVFVFEIAILYTTFFE